MFTKIFPASVIKEIDRLTIEKQGITSDRLMERAVDALLAELQPYLSKEHKIMIFSGVGNNGGDGLVLARKLLLSGYHVEPVIVAFSEKKSPDFEINFQRLIQTGVRPSFFGRGFSGKANLVVDAVFGVGLNRPAGGLAAEAIHYINKISAEGATVFSVDMPSGLYADRLNAPEDPVVKAGRVFTFQFPKYSFFFEENRFFVPEFTLVDIGLDKGVIEVQNTFDFYVTDAPVSLVRSDVFASKAAYGHVAILGGVEGKSGAVILASLAALRAGAGWVTAYVPESTAQVIRAMRSEIMTSIVEGESVYVKDFRLFDRRKYLAVGPGLGTHYLTAVAMKKLLQPYFKPVVLDADALNILAKNPDLFSYIPPDSILTPHEGELRRLAGSWSNTMEKWEVASQLAQKNNVIIVAKGRYTLITDGSRRFFNSTGNPALAKAGTGDVLTGVLTAMLARGIKPLEAAVAGVYYHGKAADCWIEKHGNYSLLPTDLIDCLSMVE